MGDGTYALDGLYVGTLDSGKGGTLTPTFKIPDKLKGLSTIAIRMDCPAGLYAYNWFYNNTAAVTIPPAPGYTGIPTFSISAVVKGKTVTIAGKDFPAGQTFTVTMGEYGTYGIGGIKVGTYESGTGGSFTKTFDVPFKPGGEFPHCHSAGNCQWIFLRFQLVLQQHHQLIFCRIIKRPGATTGAFSS